MGKGAFGNHREPEGFAGKLLNPHHAVVSFLFYIFSLSAWTAKKRPHCVACHQNGLVYSPGTRGVSIANKNMGNSWACSAPMGIPSWLLVFPKNLRPCSRSNCGVRSCVSFIATEKRAFPGQLPGG